MIDALIRGDNLPRRTLITDRIMPLAIILLAAGLRFWQLGYPKKLVFDETYYVKDAWTLVNTGTEKSWPAEANSAFESGQVDGYLNEPSFVVHPPLGKWIIGFGMAVFGADNAFSWRISVAILGVASVALLIVVARQLFQSSVAGNLAGFLLAIDGHAIVLSRTGLLDNVLAFFVLLAFWMLIRDREWQQKNTAQLSANSTIRPWLLGCAAALGAATATKWSGLYVFVFFAGYIAVSEYQFWRQSQHEDWAWRATWLNIKNGLASVSVLSLVYLSSWLGWLSSANGYDRMSDANPLVALWNYHVNAYNFHIGLSTPHSYASSALTWPLALRPTSFFYESLGEGESGCRSIGGCSSAITALGNPIIWWLGAAALTATTVWLIRERDRTAALIVIGFSAGWVPWLLYPNRTAFQFYSVIFLPFMVLALVYAVRKLVRRARNPILAKQLVLAGTIFVFGVSLFFLPIWNGTWIPFWFWQIHMWLPSWI